MASKILNVQDFRAKPNLDPEAEEFLNKPEVWREALQANRQHIQDAINSIKVMAMLNDQGLAALDPSSAVSIGTVVRFPAGIYRIYGKLNIPYCQCFSLVGDGGVGGTVIVQHKDDEPIIEFTEEDTWGWTIENLWFKWNKPQTCDHDHSVAIHFCGGQSRSYGFYHGAIKRCVFENAYRGVGITPLKYKFFVDQSVTAQVIRELSEPSDPSDPESKWKELPTLSSQFPSSVWEPDEPRFTPPAKVTVERSGYRWRIDEKDNPKQRYFIVWNEDNTLNVYRGVPLPVWGTHIDQCKFVGCKGSAIYLSGNCGMPSNSISNTMIENGIKGRENEETQLVLSAQSGMSLTSLDMEASSTTVIYADSSVITINGLHLESIKVQRPPGRILYFADTSYEIHGLSCGINVDPPCPLNLIEGGFGANIVVTGVTVNFNPGSPTHPIYLFAGQGEDPHGRKNSFRLVGQYKHPPKKKLKLYDEGIPNMVELVTVDPIKVRRKLIFPEIAAGALRRQERAYLFSAALERIGELDKDGGVSTELSQTFKNNKKVLDNATVEVDQPRSKWTIVDSSSVDGSRREYLIFRENQTLNVYEEKIVVTGARPGDIVSLGPPEELQAGLIAFGLVTAPDTVEVRILNTTPDSITPVSRTWTITTGGGQQFE